MKKRLLLTFLFALFILFGCTSYDKAITNNSKNTLDNKTTVKNDANKGQNRIDYTYYSSPNFYIYYPRGWKLDQSKNGIFDFISPLEDNNDKISEDFIVEIWDGKQNSSKEFKDYELSVAGPRDVITKEQNTSYKGKQTYSIEIEGPEKDTGLPMYYKTTFFRNGIWVYRLSYAIEKSKMGSYKPIMESILDKFIIGS